MSLKRNILIALLLLCVGIVLHAQHLGSDYRLKRIIPVTGRQGIAVDEHYYYVSDSKALYKYDKNGITLPTQYMAGSFCKYTFKAHIGNHCAYLVRINEAGIAKDFRCLAKKFFNLIALAQDLFFKTSLVDKRRQTMRIRFRQKFTTSRIVQCMKQVKHGRSMNLKLFESNSRN